MTSLINTHHPGGAVGHFGASAALRIRLLHLLPVTTRWVRIVERIHVMTGFVGEGHQGDRIDVFGALIGSPATDRA